MEKKEKKEKKGKIKKITIPQHLSDIIHDLFEGAIISL